MLDIHIKKRYMRANQGPFVNKTLQKAAITRSTLLNKFFKNNTQSNESALNKFFKNNTQSNESAYKLLCQSFSNRKKKFL